MWEVSNRWPHFHPGSSFFEFAQNQIWSHPLVDIAYFFMWWRCAEWPRRYQFDSVRESFKKYGLPTRVNLVSKRCMYTCAILFCLRSINVTLLRLVQDRCDVSMFFFSLSFNHSFIHKLKRLHYYSIQYLISHVGCCNSSFVKYLISDFLSHLLPFFFHFSVFFLSSLFCLPDCLQPFSLLFFCLLFVVFTAIVVSTTNSTCVNYINLTHINLVFFKNTLRFHRIQNSRYLNSKHCGGVWIKRDQFQALNIK